MMTKRNQESLDKFKKSYILKKANKLAEDYQFVKGFTLKRMIEYIHLLSKFLEQNKKKIDIFVKNLQNDKKIDKNSLFLKELSFLISIPKLIRFADDNANEFDIDYVFLKNNFREIDEQEKRDNLENSLKELENKFTPIYINNIETNKNDDLQFNIVDLYNFGNFILTFLNNFELRQTICINFLSSELEASNNKFKEVINQQVIQNQNNINTWNSVQSISC
ncbi:MAG: hypothetical protein REH79_02850 [Spiroplasma sp.]|nr:hypothetical protein [Spiroplasma sp.]